MGGTRIIRARDVGRLMSAVGVDALMDSMIARVEAAFFAFDPLVSVAPVRAGFAYAAPAPGLIEWMPVMERGRAVTIKTVGYHPENPARRRTPTILSTVARYDVRTGRLTALADATVLTAFRTGAATAVASKLLADPGARTIGLIGAGAQAVTQLHALLRTFPNARNVLVHDIDPDAAASFPARIAAFAPEDLSVRAAAPAAVVEAADILCTCTSVEAGAGPVFEDGPAKPWLHVNAVGADFPGKHEVPRALLARSLVVPDFREQAEKEGECQTLEAAAIGPDLATMVRTQGGNLGGRSRTTVFDSTGFAIEDHAALDLILELCAAHDLGVTIEIEADGGDPLNPYDVAGAGALSAVETALEER